MIDDAQSFVASSPIRVRAFREADAAEQARLRPATRHQGLSFGDRACLALGLLTGLPVLTADKRWAELDIGVEIRLIR